MNSNALKLLQLSLDRSLSMHLNKKKCVSLFFIQYGNVNILNIVWVPIMSCNCLYVTMTLNQLKPKHKHDVFDWRE